MENLQLLEGSPIIFTFSSHNKPLTETSKSIKCYGMHKASLEIVDATTLSITVEGCVNATNVDTGAQLNDEDITWTTLAIISATSLEQVYTLTENGIYYIDLSGIQRVRLNVTLISGTPTISMMRAD